MTELIDFLRTLAPVADDLADQLNRIFKVKSFKRETFLVKAGIINNQLFFIQEGLIRGYRMRGSKQATLWILGEKDVIASGESYQTQTPGRENMQVLQDAVVACCHFSDLEKCYLEFPALERHGRLIAQKYSRLWFTLLDGIRLQTAKERYQFLTERYPNLVEDVYAKHLASYLDISEVTLSRIKPKE